MAFKDIFTVLKKGPLPPQEEMENIPAFMFCRYLGGHKVTIFPANEFNKYYKEIPIDIQYKMIKKIFAGKNIYPTMVKKGDDEVQYDGLVKHFKISRERAREYSEYLTEEEIDHINSLYEIKG